MSPQTRCWIPRQPDPVTGMAHRSRRWSGGPSDPGEMERVEAGGDDLLAPSSEAAYSALYLVETGAIEGVMRGPGGDLRVTWATGKGSVVQESGRGKVLEAVPAGPNGVVAKQAVTVDLGAKGGATLSMDYRVMAGDAQIRANVTYLDATGRQRNSTLEVTGGEGPGGWSSWTGDVGALRPHPNQVKEVRLVVEGGTVRLDNVALTPK